MVDVSQSTALTTLDFSAVDRIGVYRPISDYDSWRFVLRAGKTVVKEFSIHEDSTNWREFSAFKTQLANELNASWIKVELSFPYLHYREWIRNG